MHSLDTGIERLGSGRYWTDYLVDGHEEVRVFYIYNWDKFRAIFYLNDGSMWTNLRSDVTPISLELRLRILRHHAAESEEGWGECRIDVYLDEEAEREGRDKFDI